MRRAAPRRTWPSLLLRLLALAVLICTATVGWRALDRTKSVAMAMDGAPVKSPAAALGQAERSVRTWIGQRNGTVTKATRCYYTARAADAQGVKGVQKAPYSLTGDILCGPAVFVDESPGKQYVSYPVRSAASSGGSVRLTADTATPTTSAGPASGDSLIRPDGSTPKPGPVLTVPTPPPAAPDLLTTTSTLGGPLTPAGADAVMIGRNSGVKLGEFGFVNRFGAGASARSAPATGRLLAFTVTPMAGEYATEQPQLSLDIDGVVRGPLVVGADHVVTVVPTAAKRVQLLLNDSGVTQRLSLLTGQPAATNPQLSSRPQRRDDLKISKPVTLRVTQPEGTSGLVSGTVTFTSVWLSYWGADSSTPSSSTRAFLHITVAVRLAGDARPYGAEAGLITAAATGDEASTARNAAADPRSDVDDVVEVPADLTSGSVNYTGTVEAAGGTISVLTPVSVNFDLPS